LDEAMENYELSSEITIKGHKYYLQTALISSQHQIITSLFHEGSLLSKQQESYDPASSVEQAQELLRHCHEELKKRINSLLDISVKLGKTEDVRAHLKLGEALYHQCLYKEAMSEVVRAIKLGAKDSRAFSILGNCLLALNDGERAVRAFQHGIQIAPNYPDLHNDLGRAYLYRKQCRDAVKEFEKAIDLNKYYVNAYLNLAIALCANVIEKDDFELSRDLPERLLEIFARVIQLKPSLDTPSIRKMVEETREKRYSVVFESLSRLQDESGKLKGNNLSLDLYLILKFNSNTLTEEDIDRYIERTRQALIKNPNFADLKNDLGILYTAKCKLFIDKANESFREALKINRDFKKAEKNLRLSENDRQGIHLLLKALLD